jgi:murein L,D-transpeptidase YcbB/YkuD
MVKADTLLASTEILTYYKDNDFNPIWVNETSLNSQGEAMFELMKNAFDYGLLPEMFHLSTFNTVKDSSLVDAEILLSNAFLLFSAHVSVGCIDSMTYQYTFRKDSVKFDLVNELHNVSTGVNVKELIDKKQPKYWEYQQLQLGLIKFLDQYPLDTSHFIIPNFKDDSTLCYEITKKALIAHGFLDSIQVKSDSLFIEQLKVFQRVNGLLDDAIVGKWTGKALEMSNTDRFLQAALSLEKWRWKINLPTKYIRVNIPEYTLYFIDSAAVKRKHKVVVGTYDTPTPEFHATLKRMVTNPYWHVPYSISSTEILYGAKKDTGYFEKRNYKLFKNNKEVDPKSVDWSKIRQNNFPYRVRQEGGASNSLGLLKFLFPNEHSVFVHDTPSKRYFENDIRAYSHGCVRLQYPFDLAKAILQDEEHLIVADTLDSLIARGTQKVIELNEPFEVFMEYFTATGDSSGTIHFHPDVYARDNRYLRTSFYKFLPK